MSLYKIVFEGKIAEGYSIEDVKKTWLLYIRRMLVKSSVSLQGVR